MNTRDQVCKIIGVGYAAALRPDPRIHQVIVDPLGDARTVINVGAGGGNYGPTDRIITSVEPSLEMITQRTTGAGTAVRGVAEPLPFRD
ncbi:transcriptional regulator, MerR family [hydrothermal vent metagenome]|uniref:Transcriptional regulator, MerR family n=1 Tax=hydrothermal vent metagenome TaxID=652676 RepID=A0A160V9I2_9ZZZZ